MRSGKTRTEWGVRHISPSGRNRNCDSSVARPGLFCVRKSAFLPRRGARL
nr:MAG TPA_asm: hypothetical protein [Caudoviricetes sp.]